MIHRHLPYTYLKFSGNHQWHQTIGLMIHHRAETDDSRDHWHQLSANEQTIFVVTNFRMKHQTNCTAYCMYCKINMAMKTKLVIVFWTGRNSSSERYYEVFSSCEAKLRSICSGNFRMMKQIYVPLTYIHSESIAILTSPLTENHFVIVYLFIGFCFYTSISLVCVSSPHK